jgi:hypothetical protein
MGTPLPLNGTNPYTGMYQNRQFGVGSPYSPTSQHQVSGYLETPPATLVTAEAQTPLVQQAEFFGLYNQFITVSGAPTSGTMVLQYGVNFTSALPLSSTAQQVQTALQGLSSVGTGNITVAGNPGAWTVTLTGAFANKPVELLKVRSFTFVGGTKPSINIYSTNIQQGISPF